MLVADLIGENNNGLIMAMGKGGVGKTLAASANAVMITQKGHEVHLTTPDPAAHVQDFIDQLGITPFALVIKRYPFLKLLQILF